MSNHPNEKTSICPACGQSCSKTALTETVITHEVCHCEAWPYPHLVETTWHKLCYVAFAVSSYQSAQQSGSARPENAADNRETNLNSNTPTAG